VTKARKTLKESTSFGRNGKGMTRGSQIDAARSQKLTLPTKSWDANSKKHVAKATSILPPDLRKAGETAGIGLKTS